MKIKISGAKISIRTHIKGAVYYLNIYPNTYNNDVYASLTVLLIVHST